VSLFAELKRRDASRAGIAYTVAAWLPIQVTDTVYPRIGLPGSAVTLVIVLINEQDGPSKARLHVAPQTRGSASLLRPPSPNKYWAAARVGTSLCQVNEQDGPSMARLHVGVARP